MIKVLLCIMLVVVMPMSATAANLQQSITVEQQTQQHAQKSQQLVTQLDKETEQLLAEYQRLMQQSDYQQAYNQELQTRLTEQQQEIEQAKRELVELQITRLHIMPFLREKTADLKRFIQLDLPFEQQERLNSVEKLEQLLASSKVTLAEKFRRFMELWQTESDYSYNLASYQGSVDIQGEKRLVHFLRIGRMALYWLALDGQSAAYWQAHEKQWKLIDNRYIANLQNAMRVADKQIPPELLLLPIISKENN